MPADFSPDPLVQQPTPHHAAVAEALSYLIRATSGEAAFAVLGHWGRGKSFIAKLIADRLHTTHATIHFSSWQYPNRPECWLSLHELIVNAIHTQGLLRSSVVALRLNINRNGIIPLLYWHSLAFLASIGAIESIIFATLAAHLLGSIVGFAGLALAARFWLNGRRLHDNLTKRFLSLPSRRQELGLQETVASDIRQILASWLGEAAKFSLYTHIIPFAATTATLPGVYVALRSEYLATQSTLSIALLFAAWGAWSALVLAAMIVGNRQATRNTMLIVLEDLDRLPSDTALAIMEAITVILEPSRLPAQIQLLVLVDETTLREAVANRYGNAEAFSGLMDRLFTAYVRLPPLDASQLSGLANLFIKKDEYDAAIAQLAIAKEEAEAAQTNFLKSVDLLTSASSRKPTGVVATTRQETRSRIVRPNRVIEGGVYEYTVTVPSTRPATPEELEAERRKLENELEAAKDEKTKAAARLEAANMNLSKADSAARDLRSDIPHASIEGINLEYKASLEMRPSEKQALLKAINRLAKARNIQMGPRSIHVFSKKYYLLKCLWTTLLSLQFEGTEAELSDSDRDALVEALRAAVAQKFGVKETVEEVGSAIIATDRVKQMRVLASYVS